MGFKSRDLPGTFGPPIQEIVALEDLFDLVASAAPLHSRPPVKSEDLCEISFTSGTTGVPKGVTLTHGKFVTELEALHVAFPLSAATARYRCCR
jgi:long-subunit acyl-CoA synthetase (AMP-forming)